MEHEENNELQTTMTRFHETLSDFANHVKKTSIIRPPLNRWMVVTGCKKIGDVVQFVREQFNMNGLIENTDWFLLENREPDPCCIYNLLYDHNGKILVLRHFQHLLLGTNRYHFWMNLFDDSESDYPYIQAPNPTKECYYDARMSSKERYYAEVNEGKRPDKFQFTGCVVILTDASTYDFYVTENQVPSNFITSLKGRSCLIECK